MLRLIASAAAVVAGFGCVVAARLRVGDRFDTPHAGLALALWLTGIVLVVAGCWPIRGRRFGLGERAPSPDKWSGAELALVLGLTVVALLLRLYDLEGIPWIMSGDEGSVGQEALGWLNGETTNPFVTGWSSHPTFYFILQSWSVALFGPTLFALRVTSALAGALTVPLLYVFARRYWGPGVGFAAAGVLTGMAAHIHYSRLSIDPAFDPPFVLAVLGAVIEGQAVADGRRARLWFIFAGAVFGVSLYFWGSRLLAVQMLVVAAYSLLTGWRRWWVMLRHWLAFAAVGLAVDLPIFAQFYRHPDDFFARMNLMGVFQTGHVARSAEPLQFLWEQLRVSLLAFNGSPDTSPFFDVGATILRPGLSVLFTIGVLLALRRAFRPPEFAMLTLLLGTLIFGSTLIVTPPQSHHLVIGFPAVAIFIGQGLVEPARWLRRRVGGPRVAWAGLLAAAVILLAAADARWYLADFSRGRRFGDVNTEVAHVLGYRLRQKHEDVKFYFFGPGRMFAEFPSIPYLTRAQGYNVHQPLAAPPDFVTPTPKPIFVFLPERSNEAQFVMAECPGGTLEAVPGIKGSPLFFWYEPARGCE